MTVLLHYLPLLGVLVVVAGFALRFNPVPVVVVAGIVSGLAAGESIGDILALLGTSFVSERALLLFVLTLPAIGVLERAGLREHARNWIARLRGLTLSRLLITYLAQRQILCMLGLTDIEGHAQSVRPLLAPMAEAAAEKRGRPLEPEERNDVRAFCAATDNVGRFFGEDVFIALGAVLLIQGFYAQHGIQLEPLHIALWALPTAIAAFIIHAIRTVLFARRIASHPARGDASPSSAQGSLRESNHERDGIVRPSIPQGERTNDVLKIEHAYWLIALFLAGAAWLNLRERRWSHAAFWGVLAALIASGKFVLDASATHHRLPAQLAGVGVIVLAVLAPRMIRGHLAERDPAAREADALRLGHRLFGPALLIPLVTLLVALFGAYAVVGGVRLFDPVRMTLTGLALACVVALVAALWVTRAKPMAGLTEGRRLLDTLGWAALLPLTLAALGGVFAATGVGTAVADLVRMLIPVNSALACVIAFGLGMVLFTVIMGNAFAAFPVLMAGIGIPLLIRLHGANPAILGALGMVTGYCGTLFTPMAANFNIVPVALLELPNQNDVIRAQWKTGAALLIVNLALMYFLVFRF